MQLKAMSDDDLLDEFFRAIDANDDEHATRVVREQIARQTPEQTAEIARQVNRLMLIELFKDWSRAVPTARLTAH